jgi:transposase InsO family protein
MRKTYKLEQKKQNPKPPRGLSRRGSQPYPPELRRKLVKLRLEEGYPLQLVAREAGISQSVLSEWIRRYRAHGEAGLQPLRGGIKAGTPKVAAAVKAQIVALKQQYPHFGVKRIAHVLRRMLFLPGSHETVRRTLHQHRLLPQAKKKAPKNPPKPRFFERATPNQMWQSDIFTFRLGGKNAYLIAFLDDHSRYVVGLDLFRSQTAEHVLEVYRTAVAEYGVPKEMLTDNGRQYTSWRGKTRFEQELQKDRVHHFRSQPHHPMTLGKVERFWKTIWEEFLCRAQFDSFDQARERIRLWVKYYNHKRPHQSLDGLCPADRFFAVAKELRAVIERGIAANVQELALRGQPQSPFYMVGRLGQQSVVLQAEKGQIKLVVDDVAAPAPTQALTYDINQPQSGALTHDERKQTQEGTEGVQCPSTSAGGADRVDGTPAAGGSLSAVGDQLDAVGAMARAGHGRDADGLAATLSDRTTVGTGVDDQTGAAVGAAGVDGRGQVGQAGETAGQTAAGVNTTTGSQREITPALVEQEAHASESTTGSAGVIGPAASGVVCPSAVQPDHGERGGATTGHRPQELLPVGAASAGGAGGGDAGAATGTPADAPRSPEGTTATPGAAVAETSAGLGAASGPARQTEGSGPL